MKTFALIVVAGFAIFLMTAAYLLLGGGKPQIVQEVRPTLPQTSAIESRPHGKAATVADKRGEKTLMTSSDEQQIRELVATWLSASKAGDTATVLTLMTDDVVFLVAGQPPFGKQKFAETMQVPLGQPRAQIDGSSEIQEIHVSGDLAYAWSKLRVDVTPPGGAPIRRAGHTLTVFRKTAGRWQVARDANLLTPVGH